MEQSQINSVQERTILAKKRQLGELERSILSRVGKAQIKSLTVKIKSERNGGDCWFFVEVSLLMTRMQIWHELNCLNHEK